MKTTTELEQENARMLAELDAARGVLADLGELTEYISDTYPERAGHKSTVTAVEKLKAMREALTRITQIKWGWDGDCGAVAIAENAL